MGVSGQHNAPLPLGKTPGTHCTGSWVNTMAGLGRRRKSCLHRDSITGPSSPWRVAIATALFLPTSSRICRISYWNFWALKMDSEGSSETLVYIKQQGVLFLISNFRRVLNVLCFFLGNSPASEFYMPTFRNTLFHLHRQIGVRTCV